MKRSVKKSRRSPVHTKKHRSAAHTKKRRSPSKRIYRMNVSSQRVYIKPVFGDEIAIDLPVGATVKDLKDLLPAPSSSDTFNQLFVARPGDADGANPIVLEDSQLVSTYGNDIFLTVSPKSFVVRVKFLGQTNGIHGPFGSEEEALRAAWVLSNDVIRDVRKNPRQPYLNEDYLNLRHVKIDDKFVPQTKAELDERLGQIWNGAFGYSLIRGSSRGSHICMCGRVH